MTVSTAELSELLGDQSVPTNGSGEVVITRSGPVAVVSLARPKAHNALRFADWQRLGDLFRELGREPGELRVTVVRGLGERAFSAGADIREFPERRMPSPRAEVYNEVIAEALRAVMACPIPVLAMIRGLAVGGGCELAAACDLRIASEDARMGIPIGRLGVTLGEVEARAVVRLIGSARLKDLVFSGRLVSAQEAFSMGLVDRVVPVQSLVEMTTEMAEAIASAAPITIRATKLLADFEGQQPAGEEAAILERLAAAAYDGNDLKEGVEAFLSNRAPRFGA